MYHWPLAVTGPLFWTVHDTVTRSPFDARAGAVKAVGTRSAASTVSGTMTVLSASSVSWR